MWEERANSFLSNRGKKKLIYFIGPTAVARLLQRSDADIEVMFLRGRWRPHSNESVTQK